MAIRLVPAGADLVARGCSERAPIVDAVQALGRAVHWPRIDLDRPADSPAAVAKGQWARHGVNGDAIAPGYVATAKSRALRADPDRSRQILERLPAETLGPALRPGQCCGVLAASASDYVHGIVLALDGGWLAR